MASLLTFLAAASALAGPPQPHPPVGRAQAMSQADMARYLSSKGSLGKIVGKPVVLKVGALYQYPDQMLGAWVYVVDDWMSIAPLSAKPVYHDSAGIYVDMWNQHPKHGHLLLIEASAARAGTVLDICEEHNRVTDALHPKKNWTLLPLYIPPAKETHLLFTTQTPSTLVSVRSVTILELSDK